MCRNEFQKVLEKRTCLRDELCVSLFQRVFYPSLVLGIAVIVIPLVISPPQN